MSGLAQKLRGRGLLPSLFICGDAAYECKDGIVTPWSSTSLRDEDREIFRDGFNFYLSSMRIRVEQSFGILVARWGILWRPLRVSPRQLTQVDSCCIRLHNFCIEEGDRLENVLSPEEQERSAEAFSKWHAIATSLHVRRHENAQGQRRDLEMCSLRDELTEFLLIKRISRPAQV